MPGPGNVEGMTNTPEKIVYTARATVTGGREGRAVSEDGVLDLTLTAPKEVGGPGTGTNPEQLFAVGYGACFTGALHAVAKQQGEDVTGATVTVDVGLGPEGDSFGITADLIIDLPGLAREEAEALVAAAHQICPYSNATRNNLDVGLAVA